MFHDDEGDAIQEFFDLLLKFGRWEGIFSEEEYQEKVAERVKETPEKDIMRIGDNTLLFSGSSVAVFPDKIEPRKKTPPKES